VGTVAATSSLSLEVFAWPLPAIIQVTSEERQRGGPQMSLKVKRWVDDQAPVSGIALKAVLRCLAEICNDDGTECRQSVRTMATRVGCSKRTIQRYLRVLENGGIIRRGDQSLSVGRMGHEGWRPTVYDLNISLNRSNTAVLRQGMHPRPCTTAAVGSDGVTNSHPVTPLRDDTDDKVWGNDGVTTVSHNSPLNSLEITSPESTSLPPSNPTAVVDQERDTYRDDDGEVYEAAEVRYQGGLNDEDRQAIMEKGMSGLGMGLLLRQGLLAQGCPDEIDLDEVSRVMNQEHNGGKSWEHLTVMVRLFVRDLDRFTVYRDEGLPPAEEFVFKIAWLSRLADNTFAKRDGLERVWSKDEVFAVAQESHDAMNDVLSEDGFFDEA